MNMLLNKQNAFVGAKVERNEDGKTFYVHKINDKTFWGCEKSIAEAEEFNKVGTDSDVKLYKTFTALMEKLNGEKYPYEDFSISDEELKKKERADKLAEIKKTSKKYTSSAVDNTIIGLYRKKVRGESNWGCGITVNKQFIMLLTSNEDGKCVVRVGDDVLFYDVNTKIQRLFDYEKDKNGKEVLYENFEC